MTQASVPNEEGQAVRDQAHTGGTPGASTAQALPPPPPCPGGFIYTVQPGDTMFLIARRFGVSLDALIRANPQIADPNVIQVGQQICVPFPQVPPCPGGFIYTVQPGDTMFLIARRFGVSLDALIRANPQIADPNVIQVGQQICVPAVPPPPPLLFCVVPLTGTNIAPTSFGVALVQRQAGNAFVIGVQLPDPPLSMTYVAWFMNSATNTGIGIAMTKTTVDGVWVAQAVNAQLADKDLVLVTQEPVGPIGQRPTGRVFVDGSIRQCP